MLKTLMLTQFCVFLRRLGLVDPETSDPVPFRMGHPHIKCDCARQRLRLLVVQSALVIWRLGAALPFGFKRRVRIQIPSSKPTAGESRYGEC